ncbi:MAG: hypothetical protein K5905_22835 [Roseibium sp.]|uniref:hypothetical protein n=1 Tax=Roseibium sp. TaxID=1936156 RepID=UPI0026340FAF|nr:hypothetical protein [Roseibium sp.]MCV0428303.1 hypothetical protein [Roseibium sp.]
MTAATIVAVVTILLASVIIVAVVVHNRLSPNTAKAVAQDPFCDPAGCSKSARH